MLARGNNLVLERCLRDGLIGYEIESGGAEIMACSQGSSSLSSTITEEMFHLELSYRQQNGFLTSNLVSV